MHKQLGQGSLPYLEAGTEGLAETIRQLRQGSSFARGLTAFLSRRQVRAMALNETLEGIRLG